MSGGRFGQETTKVSLFALTCVDLYNDNSLGMDCLLANKRVLPQFSDTECPRQRDTGNPFAALIPHSRVIVLILAQPFAPFTPA